MAKSPDKIRIALVGCGGRGTANARNSLRSAENVELVAMGDLFPDRLAQSLKSLTAPGKNGAVNPNAAKVNVPPERQFIGFDAYQKVLETDVDIVLNAAPPHFRPMHLRATLEAGKNAFVEKPVATDPVGVRSVLESAALADKKGLSIVCGTQFRHTPRMAETIMRVKDGAIGEPVTGQCYYNTGTLWLRKPKDGEVWSEMETQIRNWLYYTWLSGDHIVEQHIHYQDLMNWAFGGPPVSALGMGGRQVRVAPEYGNGFDHFAIEYQYENGARVLAECRQTKGCSNRTDTRIVGTKGVAYPKLGKIEGETPWKFEGENLDGSIQEHATLIKSVRDGKPVNDGVRIAETTMTAILGRMSAYTGREAKFAWAMKSSKLDLSPKKYEFGPCEMRPPAIPGKTPLV